MIDKDHILQLIKKSVNTSDPDATVILYGSYARGDYNEESDIDVLILIDKEKVSRDDKIKISYPLYDLQFDNGILISAMVVSRRFWYVDRKITPFYENVNKEGIVL